MQMCEFCGGNARLVQDHNHATGNIRGTLCTLCNSRLGWAENTVGMVKLLEYVNRKGTVSYADHVRTREAARGRVHRAKPEVKAARAAYARAWRERPGNRDKHNEHSRNSRRRAAAAAKVG